MRQKGEDKTRTEKYAQAFFTFLMILSGMLSLSNLTRESIKPFASTRSCFFAGSQKSSTFVKGGYTVVCRKKIIIKEREPSESVVCCCRDN